MVKRLASGCLVVLFATGNWMIGSAGAEPGQRVFEDHCMQCHGAEGRGGGKGPRLIPFLWSYEKALEMLRYPKCDMPPIPESELSDAEVAQIVAYLKTIKTIK
jgi:mono/diheme cytochrome c family protein